MSQIRVLDPHVRDQIAAGEVVDRPAAIVRELLDNALDAGSSRIRIETRGGGTETVLVADDGVGMDEHDALLAFERHATSKIRTSEDLRKIGTLGFRGEALAALAAVSRVELVTAAQDGLGTKVVVDHGRIVTRSPQSRSRGTTVAVSALFGAIPARKKFLRTPGTELDHCQRVVMRSALAYPGVGFRFADGERVLIDAPATTQWQSRIADLLGSKWRAGLVPVAADGGWVSVTGFAARADFHRGDREWIHLFVNSRPVRDPFLMRSVQDAYRNLLPANAFPVVVLALQLDPQEVDVNVHPAKSEVRFARAGEVRAVLVGALRRALGAVEATPTWSGRDALPAQEFQAPAMPPQIESSVLFDAALPSPTPARANEPNPLLDDPVPLGQYADCYIVAFDQRGLILVDQHVAHERILFENLTAMADQGPLARQSLLFPTSLELSPSAEEHLVRDLSAVERLGFGVEPLGRGGVLVREVPSLYQRTATAADLRGVLEELLRAGAGSVEQLFRHRLATVACHTAVRRGMRLGSDQMRFILRGLRACETPTHCPHGRVVSLRLDRDELDRRFGRG